MNRLTMRALCGSTLALLLAGAALAQGAPAGAAASAPAGTVDNKSAPDPVATAATDAATTAATSWLRLVDAGQFGESWTQASPDLQRAMTKPDWERTLQGVQGQVGAVNSRVLRNARYTRSLPSAPPGEYVVIVFDTVFERQPKVAENLVVVKGADGQWRVVGYLLR